MFGATNKSDTSTPALIMRTRQEKSPSRIWLIPLAFLALSWAAASTPQRVQLQGRLVCLAEEMRRLHDATLPTDHSHLWGFKAEDGRYYTLLRTRLSEALFTDQSLQEKDLLLSGRVFPGSAILDVEHIRSVRDGKVFQIVYYCEICEIFAVAPGICDCCQEPTERRELAK
jgi:hypothetical protein